MIMKKLSYILFVGLVALSCFLPAVCSSLQAQTVIPFARGVTDKKEIKLSEVASEIRYITLETTEDNLLDRDAVHLLVDFAGKYLFVCDGHHIYQFTPEGKYIRKIGKRGQGPGEFRKHILAVVYDEAKEHIIATDYLGGKAIVFSFEGKYLYDFKIKGKILAFLPPDGIYGYCGNYVFSKERTGVDLIMMNDQGKRLKEFRFNYKEGKRYPPIFEDGLFYNYQGFVYYKNPFETQLFRIEGKKKMLAYELDLGTYAKYEKEDPQKVVLDKEKGVGSVLPTEAGKKRFTFSSLFETDSHLYIRYYQEQEWRLGLYDKRSGQVVRVHSGKMKGDGFVDDLEGGLPFMPVRGNGKTLINMIPAEHLLEKVQPSQARGSLKKAMENLLVDDNPVIQVITLK